MAVERMTQHEIERRALDRARAEHLCAWRLADGRFLVKSRELAPGSFHLVAVGVDGVARCDCPGFKYRESCTHAAAVQRRLAREYKPTAAAVTRTTATEPQPIRRPLGDDDGAPSPIWNWAGR